jgi:hypothetical protein
MSKKNSATPVTGTSLAGHALDDIIQLARVALEELTTPDTFSEPPAVNQTPGVVTIDFPNTQPGYPGWVWSVSVNDYADMAPTVLELQMVPSDGALLSPAWVPWVDRMEDYLAHEKEVEAQAVIDKQAELDAEDDDDDEDDDVDFDGDVDGVDIDQLDLDPTPLEIPVEINDVFDHVEFEEPDPLDP